MCFVDFHKAYDCVRRDLLLQRLAGLGVCGDMLRAVTCMYSSVPMCARQDGQLGPTFDSALGVKQGDPMSPLLFGLFLDGVERCVSRGASGAGVEIGGQLCQMLLYADDIVLLAKSARDLQQQLNALGTFCQDSHMRVNVQKTKVLVLNGGRHPNCAVSVDGSPLECVDSFRYLGLEVHRCKGLAAAPAAVQAAATQAACGMMARVRDRDISHIGLRVRLFGNLVLPVMQYGCEVWATPYVCDPLKPLDNPIQPVQTQFLRQVAGGWLRKSINTKLLLAEFGCQPVSWQWCKLVCRYWNRLVDQEHYPLLCRAFRAEMQQACQGVAGWGRDVLCMLHQVDPDTHAEAVEAIQAQEWDQIPQLNESGLLGLWRQHWLVWPAADCDPAVETGTLAAYTAWMTDSPASPAPYVETCDPIDTDCLLSLILFRLGAHNLRVSTGRWEGVPREDRLCCKCHQHAVEDEHHVLFVCPHYEQVRQRFQPLYEAAAESMRQLMTHSNQQKVASLVHAILNEHSE